MCRWPLLYAVQCLADGPVPDSGVELLVRHGDVQEETHVKTSLSAMADAGAPGAAKGVGSLMVPRGSTRVCLLGFRFRQSPPYFYLDAMAR